jgi:hypothetical protein
LLRFDLADEWVKPVNETSVVYRACRLATSFQKTRADEFLYSGGSPPTVIAWRNDTRVAGNLLVANQAPLQNVSAVFVTTYTRFRR